MPPRSRDEAARRSPGRGSSKTSLSVIGAGRLGTALARALAACGYRVGAVVALHARHARRAAEQTGANPVALTPKELDLLPPTDLLLVTTPDDSVGETAARLAASARPVMRRMRPRVALHASGALSSDALAPLRERGFSVGSMHPLVSVSDPVVGAGSLRSAFYCIEGDARAVRAARKLVRDLGGKSFSIRTGDKALYHAAAVMASGHAVALFDLAAELLADCGLAEASARRVLMPLVESTYDNLSVQRRPARALTGTFARADVRTVRKHLAALRAREAGEALAVYALLGNRSLRLAEENGADRAALREIARVLEEVIKF